MIELVVTITITSPTNTTYLTSSVWLNFTINENISWIGYSIDGNTNVTITGNTLIKSLSTGTHYIVLYANDTFGNIAKSTTIWFTVVISEPSTTMNSSTSIESLTPKTSTTTGFTYLSLLIMISTLPLICRRKH